MMGDLKDCPFCGGNSFVRRRQSVPIIGNTEMIICANSKCLAMGISEYRWNRRASDESKAVE